MYPIKEVEHNPAIEKLGGYILVNGYYEQEIIPFTAEEIVLKNKDLVPFSVPNMAIRLSLINAGISIKSIDEAIAMMPDGVDKEQIQTMWDYAVYFERNNETLISMATNLGISEAVLDQLFINAQ